MTDTSAPTPAKLNILQLLDVAKNIVWDMSPRVSAGIKHLMLDLVRTVEDDEPLLRDRVMIALLDESMVEDSRDIGPTTGQAPRAASGS